MENVIEVENLTHCYGKWVIHENLTFTVPRGSIFGLLGKNGVGKTTLIKILMGFLRPVSGRCRVLGEDSHNLSPAAKTKIGLLFEGHLAYEFMSIAQIEKFYSAYYPSWNRDLYYGLVDKLDLPYDHKIKNMSCGQRSQVVLGLIFAQEPELMILDDYSMGLDAGYRRLFLEYLSEYVKDGTKTVFVTSHIVQDLENLVNEVMFLLVITGVIVGAAQFTPEMIGHSFRLSLHLPVQPNSMVLCCVLAGLHRGDERVSAISLSQGIREKGCVGPILQS